jgi:hypothetical protein
MGSPFAIMMQSPTVLYTTGHTNERKQRQQSFMFSSAVKGLEHGGDVAA